MKLVCIINGSGGVGKDHIVSVVSKYYKVRNVSSIDCIKEICREGGWDPEDKSLAARKLLADVKAAFTAFNDLPTQSLLDEYTYFLNTNNEIMFVHIREPGNIQNFKNMIDGNVKTLLVKDDTMNGSYGNAADDNVNDFDYDYYIENNNKGLSDEDILGYFRDIVNGV